MNRPNLRRITKRWDWGEYLAADMREVIEYIGALEGRIDQLKDQTELDNEYIIRLERDIENAVVTMGTRGMSIEELEDWQ